ncbi:unnamed protein product [Malus baccata var. baccata]
MSHTHYQPRTCTTFTIITLSSLPLFRCCGTRKNPEKLCGEIFPISLVLKMRMARGKHTHFSGEPMSFEGISGHLRPCHGYLRVAISSPHLALHDLSPSRGALLRSALHSSSRLCLHRGLPHIPPPIKVKHGHLSLSSFSWPNVKSSDSDSCMYVFCKGVSRSIVWTEEKENGALENFISEKRQRYESAEDCADNDEAKQVIYNK